MNNFKELQQQEEEKYSEKTKNVKNKIDSNLNTLGVFSTVIDMYFSKVINYVVNLSGGTLDENSEPSDKK
jgi:hypothetical protein